MNGMHVSVLSLMISMATATAVFSATLEVGPGKAFRRIEDANAKAQAGDTILVYAGEGDVTYRRTAVFVRQKGLMFKAKGTHAGERVRIVGTGFEYSGDGAVPRAIFQFNAGADNCVLDGFELTGAHNQSHNGAGVRIIGANHVTIRNCDIHNNDMGIMSSGDGTTESAIDQRIEDCLIHHNGDPGEPGQNHNLYLGGTSVTLSACEVHHSLTGQNVKSRAHHTRVEYSYIHDSANREFDLVDSADTAQPESHAILIGNIIAKDPHGNGNGTVIHFGQDGGKDHQGTLYLVFNTIITSSVAPVVDLSAPGAHAVLIGNLVSDGGIRQNNQVIVQARKGASLSGVTGHDNWFSGGFRLGGDLKLDPATNRLQRATAPLFVDAAGHNYRLTSQAAREAHSSLVLDRVELPPVPGRPAEKSVASLTEQYRHPAGTEKRPAEEKLTLGAYAGSSR